MRRPSEEAISEPEPLPILHDPDKFAVGFYKRKEAEARAKLRPPKGSKPRMFIDNDKSDPSDKK